MAFPNHQQNGPEPREGGGTRRLAIETPYIHRMQRRHFFFYNFIPFLGVLGAIVLARFQPVTRTDLILFVSMWLLTGLGISAGYHRLFTHRAYRASPGVRVALATLGSMAGLGPVISWAAMHRRHHQFADKSGDMHSPNLHGDSLGGRIRGFLHAHVSWMVKHEYPNVAHYAPDLIEDRAIVRVSRNYQTLAVVGVLIPAVVGGLATWSLAGALSGLLWGGLVRMFVVAQSISALNSFSHTVGSRPYRTRDNSRNSYLLGLFVWGEGWHHNHHAFPTSASFGLMWYRVDLSYWLILSLRAVGLAWDVKVPTREQIASRDERDMEAFEAIATGHSSEVK